MKKCKKKVDAEIKKKIYVGKKIVVLISWPGHSDYKKTPKKYISGKKTGKKCMKKVGPEINRGICKLARIPRYKTNRSPV